MYYWVPQIAIEHVRIESDVIMSTPYWEFATQSSYIVWDLGLLILTSINLISVRISNHMHSNVWSEIAYDSQTSKVATVSEWMSNFTPCFILDVVTYPCWD